MTNTSPDEGEKPAPEKVLGKAPVKAPRPRQAKPVRRARPKKRHFGLLFSFFLVVLAPIFASGWYLYERAADQYASRVGFSVRVQDKSAPVDFLNGIGSLQTNTTTDTDILYEFIQSQEMVELVDANLDLRTLYSRHLETDPVFAFDPKNPVEDLLKYWRRMVAVYYDSGTGLIELRVLAFSAEDSVAIAQEILAQSSVMINRLSAIAREDTTRYAREELDVSLARLKGARRELTMFRAQNEIVDPTADVQGQMSLLSSLQAQQAETLIELDLLKENTNDTDPRVENLRRRVEIIQRRIDAERKKFGLGDDTDETFATLLGRFEELSVDSEFALTNYLAAQQAYDTALREAQQQSRYLAAYLSPTRPQSAEFPQRAMLLGLVALFISLIWAIVALIYYSVRDRR